MAKLPFPPFTADSIRDISEQISQLLPNEPAREELHSNVQLILQQTLSRLDLVSRQEFDAQTAVLGKTRTKLEQLELEIERLNNKHGL